MLEALIRITQKNIIPIGYKREIVENTLRIHVWAISLLYFVCHVVIAASYPERFNWELWLVASFVFVPGIIALKLPRKWTLVSQMIWLVGLLIAVTLALVIFRRSEIAYLYAVIPLLAVSSVGWRAGLVTVGVIIALILFNFHAPGLNPPPSGGRLQREKRVG